MWASGFPPTICAEPRVRNAAHVYAKRVAPQCQQNPSAHLYRQAAPGTSLVEIIYQIFEILTYVKVNTKDPLNKDACSWAREHQSEFPIDRRPLKRRTLSLEVTPL